MKKEVIFSGKKMKTIWFSLLMNAIFWAVLFLIMRPCFETNDDISIAMMVNGARGVRDAHVVCQNYILGLIYKAIYGIGQGALPWYTILQFLTVYVSLSTVTYVLFQKLKEEQAMLISGILLCYFGYECYIKMQYTKSAAIACCAGLLLLFWEASKNRDGKLSFRGIFFGGALAFWGSLYRFEEAIVCVALMSGIGLYLLLSLNEEAKEVRRKKLLTYVGVFLPVLVLMAAAEGFDRYVYASDPEWNYYSEYNGIRCELMDYSLPLFKEHEAEFKELGVSKTAYKVFRNAYNFYDPDVFSLEVIQKFAQMRPKNELNKNLVKDFFLKYPIGYLKIYVFLAFAMLAVLWIFWSKKTWKVLLVAAYDVAMMGVLDFVMFYQDRFLKNRVEAGLWFAISLVVIWLLDREKIKITGQNVLIVLLCLLAVNQGTWQERWRPNCVEEETNRDEMQSWYEEAVSADPDGLYLAKIGTMTYTIYNLTDPIPTGSFENVVWYGGWEMANPGWKHKMAEFGVVNPYKDLIDKEHVYIVDNKIELTMKYIREYYQKDAKEELVKEVGNLKVYRIVTGTEESDCG